MWYQHKAYDVFCLSMSFCLDTGSFNTVYFREFHSPVPAASSKSNLLFSVQCCDVAIAIVSPSITTLPLQYMHMLNLSRQLHFRLSLSPSLCRVKFICSPLYPWQCFSSNGACPPGGVRCDAVGGRNA